MALWVGGHSPFGRAPQPARATDTRADCLGLHSRRYRFVAFLVSGVFTGIAGALWVPLNGLTTPDILYWPFSGEIVFMAVFGGFPKFTGPLLGPLGFHYLKTYAVGFTLYSQAVLGGVPGVPVMGL